MKRNLDINTELFPTTVKVFNNCLVTEGYSEVLNGKRQHLQETSNIDSWLLFSISTPDDESALIQAFKEGLAIAVTDGSYLESHGFGTAAWIITTKDVKCSITGTSISLGDKEQQSSFCSKLLGITAIFELLNRFTEDVKFLTAL